MLRSEAIAATRGHRLHSIGVTWSDDANTEASLLLKSLTDSGFDNVVPVRLPEATEALARGIAEVIGYGTTAVCVLEPETVIALIVHLRDGAVQTSVNHRIVTEEDLIRWLSTVFTRADWQPEALVMVGSGGDDELMPILEDALSVPVFAPAEAQLALARGAALASAQNVDFAFTDDAQDFDEHRSLARRRRQLGADGPAGPAGRGCADVHGFGVGRGQPAVGAQEGRRDVRTAACRQDLSGDARRGQSPSGACRDPTGTFRRGATATSARSPARRGCAAARLQRDAGRHPRGADSRLRRAARPGHPTRRGRRTSTA